jgi:hypothetical protein
LTTLKRFPICMLASFLLLSIFVSPPHEKIIATYRQNIQNRKQPNQMYFSTKIWLFFDSPHKCRNRTVRPSSTIRIPKHYDLKSPLSRISGTEDKFTATTSDSSICFNSFFRILANNTLLCYHAITRKGSLKKSKVCHTEKLL